MVVFPVTLEQLAPQVVHDGKERIFQIIADSVRDYSPAQDMPPMSGPHPELVPALLQKPTSEQPNGSSRGNPGPFRAWRMSTLSPAASVMPTPDLEMAGALVGFVIGSLMLLSVLTRRRPLP